MKIVVLNGSPKGLGSVTMQYVLFLQKKLPQHTFAILNVCQDIKTLEDDEEAFQEIMRCVAASDAVLWAFPLYYMLVHANYKRFIELVFARGGDDACREKYAAVLTTSIHFFDHTAHEYLNGICDDLGMKYVDGYSAAMYDLLKEEERERLLLFFDGFLHAVETGLATPRRCRPVVQDRMEYEPDQPRKTVDTFGKNVVIVTDAESPEGNLAKMAARLRDCFEGEVPVINLHEIKIRGGCLGCCQCAIDNVCVYKDADDVGEVYGKLMAADVLVLAGTIRDRYLSSRWKLFFDRGFFNNHVPVFTGKQLGYLISGPLAQLANLRQILEAYAEGEGANLAGIVTDECGDCRQLDRLIDGLAGRLIDCAAVSYIRPPNFLVIGGRKLFRDEIWTGLRLVFRADHRYYRRHGLYDFPRRSLRTRIMEALFAPLMLIPAFRREFRKRIKEEMVKPLHKAVEKF